MIPAKIDSIPSTMDREQSLEAIVDWFELHKHSFYILGWSFLKTQQQMEELFYRAIIKVHKEWPRLKSNMSFDIWVTSVFIKIGRELGSKQSEVTEPRQEVFTALDQLSVEEKEAMVLTYVKGISKEETAQLLQISVEKVKELLFSGIQLLRKEMGYSAHFNGCKEYQKDYIDYLERTLERPKKIDLEIHVYHCQNCQEDLGTFQEVMLTMGNLTKEMEDVAIPPSFMEKVKQRLEERVKRKQQKIKKRKRVGLIVASIFTVLIGVGIFTGAFSSLYYTLTEDDLELRAILQQNLGERLNLEAESDGVKITINSVVADDVQTLVFYEIEDTNENNQYMMNYEDGVTVMNGYKIMNQANYPRYYPPDLESEVNNEKKNVYHGKMSLLPLKEESETIELKVNKLQKLVRDSSNPNGWSYGNIAYETGEWNFEIPVTKQPAIDYELDKKIVVEGVPVRFEKLTMAPTATILQFSINNEQSEKRLDFLNFDYLEVNEKQLKSDIYGSSFMDVQHNVNWTSYQTHFDSLLGIKPEEVKVQLGLGQFTYEDQRNIELDTSQKYPQTFEYAGSILSLDVIEEEQGTTVVVSNHEVENRVYESLQLDVIGGVGNESGGIEMYSEGVLVDKNGTEYDINNMDPFSYEEIEQPQYFTTVQSVKLHGSKANPETLVIYGYNATKYVDDTVSISLE